MAAGLSLRSTSAVAEQLEKLLEIAPPSEYFVASTILGKRAKQMNWRSWAISVPGPGATIQFSAPQHSLREVNPLVFVFSGQGPQHQNSASVLFVKKTGFFDFVLNIFQWVENCSAYFLFFAVVSSTWMKFFNA
jgi:hypothetical protein